MPRGSTRKLYKILCVWEKDCPFQGFGHICVFKGSCNQKLLVSTNNRYSENKLRKIRQKGQEVIA